MKKVSVILLILLVITAFTACDPQMDQGPHIHVIDKETATAWFDTDETKYPKAGVCSKCGETVTLEGISVSTPDELACSCS